MPVLNRLFALTGALNADTAHQETANERVLHSVAQAPMN